MTAVRWSLGAAGPVLAAAERSAWQDRACTADDFDLFFGPDNESKAHYETRVANAKAICGRCTVRAECLAAALRIEASKGLADRAGVYGGRSEKERYDLQNPGRTRRARPAGPRPVPQAQPEKRLPQAVATIPEYTDAEIALFRSKIRRAGCGREWALSVSKDGFGLFRPTSDSPRVAAHRLAYKLATGRDPGPDKVIQWCGNKRCLTTRCLRVVPRDEPARKPPSRSWLAAACL